MIRDYVNFVLKNTGKPLPGAALYDKSDEVQKGHHFTAADMATIGLYYTTAGLLGFRVDEVASLEGSENAG